MVIYGLFDQCTWDAMNAVSVRTPKQIMFALAEQARETAYDQSFEEGKDDADIKAEEKYDCLTSPRGEKLHCLTLKTDSNSGFLAVVSSHRPLEPGSVDLALLLKYERFLLIGENVYDLKSTEGNVCEFAPLWEISVDNDHRGLTVSLEELPYTFVNRIEALYAAIAEVLKIKYPEYQGKFSDSARRVWIAEHQNMTVATAQDYIDIVAELAKELLNSLDELAPYSELNVIFAAWFKTLNDQDANASWFAAMEKKYLMVFKPFLRGTTYPTAYMEA